MTQADHDELIDLYADDALPAALRVTVEAHLAGHPEAAADAAALTDTIRRLQSVPSDRPDAWFSERALDRLLREHAAAQPNDTVSEGLKTSR